MKVNTKNTFLAALALGLLLASIAGTAGAAFPGVNGKIAFTSVRDGNPEVYVMNDDGSDQTRLTNDPASDGSPAFSPDGTRIAFQSNRDGNFDIFTTNADGSDPTNLTNDPAFDGQPAFSPDGTRIAFVSQRNGGGLHVMDADGSGPIRLTSDLEGGSKPAFSPDGAEIAFVGIQTGFDIFTMNADGSGSIRLTDDPSKDLDPDWQPLVGSVTPPFDFEGFFSPVDNLPTLNAMKAGRGVPVNFSLNGDRGLDVFAEGFPKSQQVACDSTAEVDGIEETVTAGGSSLSYDANVDQYTYVWKTEKAWVGTCRQLVVKLEDDSSTMGGSRTAGSPVWLPAGNLFGPLEPLRGSPEEIVDGLLGFAREGITHLQVWLAPNTPAGIEAFVPVLEILDAEAGSASDKVRAGWTGSSLTGASTR